LLGNKLSREPTVREKDGGSGAGQQDQEENFLLKEGKGEVEKRRDMSEGQKGAWGV